MTLEPEEPTLQNPSAMDSLRQVIQAGLYLEAIVQDAIDEAKMFGQPELARGYQECLKLWKERVAIATTRHTGPLS